MNFSAQQLQEEPRYWKITFWVLSALILILMPLLSFDYGQTGDEWLQWRYGEDIWNYFFNGDKQALDYTNKQLQYSHQEYYGGFFDFQMTLIHRLFPSASILTLRHFFNAFYGALIMVFTGLVAFRLSRKWLVGIIALLFIIFSPRIFGESMNNPKDIPYAAGFIIGIYYMIALLQDLPKKVWKNAIGLAIGFGMAFGVRAAGGILLVMYFVLFTAWYYILNKSLRQELFEDNKKKLKKLAMGYGVALLLGYILGIMFWPWGLQSPIGNPLESLSGMTNRTAYLKVLFEGEYMMSDKMPWYYELKWIFISNPIIILLSAIAFVPLWLANRRSYGFWTVSLLLFGALFPILYMIYKHSTVYDTWRHVFFVYPFWIVAASLSIDMISGYVKNEKLKMLPFAIAVIGLLPAIIWTVKEHPNQYVYFNEFVGGIEGANGVYETEYYQNSGKQAADWIRKNATKKSNGQYVLVRSGMSDYGAYFRYSNDSAWLAGDYGKYNERHRLDWDYFVTYPRFKPSVVLENGMWPPKNAVYIVEAGGVPLCAVIKRTSNASVEAYQAFEEKNYELAVQKYEEYLKTDQSDENVYRFYAISLAFTGNIQGTIAAMQQAIKLDPTRPDFYELLYQVYSQIGDKANAEDAYRKMQFANANMQ